MMRDTVDWEVYYQKVSGRAARPLLKDALEVLRVDVTRFGLRTDSEVGATPTVGLVDRR